MANKHRGELDVKLLGKSWTMRLTFEAIADIEAKTAMGLAAVVRRFIQSEFGVNEVAAVIWAGIDAAHDDAPDLEAVKRAVVEEGFGGLAVTAAEFLGRAVAAGEQPAKAAKAAKR